jgi:hypothetical protein
VRARGFEPRASAVPPRGPDLSRCPSRVRTSVSGVRVRHPCRSGPTGTGTPARIRTWTPHVLSVRPLPVGIQGLVLRAVPGSRTPTGLALDQVPLPVGLEPPGVARAGVEPASPGREPGIRTAGPTRHAHPHEESNLDLGVRSAALCPLSYGGPLSHRGSTERPAGIEPAAPGWKPGVSAEFTTTACLAPLWSCERTNAELARQSTGGRSRTLGPRFWRPRRFRSSPICFLHAK